MELLEDWPNEEEKLAGIIMIVDWHTAGKCPDVVFSPEQVESWKSCLLSDARAEINVIPWERERRIALANVLANLGEIEAAGELLAEAFAMVERIQHHHKPQEAGMKLEVLRKIALRAAKLSEMDMAEAALFEILEICTTNEHVTNKIASARGAMNIYAAYFNRDNLENPETVFEHRETNSLRLQTDREYGSRVSFAPQCLSLPE